MDVAVIFPQQTGHTPSPVSHAHALQILGDANVKGKVITFDVTPCKVSFPQSFSNLLQSNKIRRYHFYQLQDENLKSHCKQMQLKN